MKMLYKYYSGQSQFLPMWTYNKFIFWLFHAKYIPTTNNYKWLGITFSTPNSYGGDTLFTYWRRMRNK